MALEPRSRSSPLWGGAEWATLQPAQAPVSFEEVVVRFTAEEWALLDSGQKALHREVMMENYWIVASLKEEFLKPAIISQLEERESAFFQDIKEEEESAGSMMALGPRSGPSPLWGGAEWATLQPAQGPVSFEEVVVRFTAEEWALLDPGQKALHREVMMENYWIVASLKEEFPKPAVISQLEEGESAFFQDLQEEEESADVESSSEKEEERNVQLEDPRMTKPRTPLLGKCDSGDAKAGPCNGPGSCLGIQFHANAHNGDLLGNSQQITDVGEIQNVCLKCGKSFSKKSTLKRHVKIHSNEKPHQCSICSKRFIERWDLNKHLRIHTTRPHSEKNTYQCPECERSYTAERHLVKHMMKAHLGANVYKCSACEKGFLDEMGLVRHQRMAHKRDRFYQCLDCGKSYKAKSSLNKHQRIHMRECKMSFRDHQSPASQWRMQGKEELHTSLTYKVDSVKSPAHVMPQESKVEDRIHMCPDCGKCFKDERCFDDHQIIHTTDQQYQCPSEGSFKEGALLSPNQIAQEDLNCNQWCDGVQPLSTGSTLALRPVTTMEENLHICPDCGKVFKCNQYFANHLRNHTQEKQSMNCSQGGTLPAGQQETPPKPSAHRCPTCKRVYANMQNLSRPQREHSECSPSKNANRREDVVLQNSFTKHQNAQTEGEPHRHKCSYCGKKFRAKNLLNKHRKTHLEGKPYECTDCGKTLAYKHIFIHYREVHREAQLCPYKCAHCGKAFQTPSSLRRHQQMHTEGKPYWCSICGKGFSFRDTLAHHQEIHTLMRSQGAICLFCGKTFSNDYCLNRHKRMHMETRSYQCAICEKAFGTKYSLRRHLEMHAKSSPGHSSNGGKDPGSSSALAKDPSSDTEENSQ